MNIHGHGVSFHDVKDPIKTEVLIHEQIKDKEFPIPYVSIPLAYHINTYGIQATQELINDVNKIYTHKKFYVCQHIKVCELDFGDNLVFTPHTTTNDPFIFIPHYNPLEHKLDSPIINFDIREYDFSFIGDFNTHPIRSQIAENKRRGVLIEPTGKWFFSHDEATQASLKQKYKSVLFNTKYPLCPPGTGPSTLRLFESLSSGGFPVIFNDIDLPKDLKDYVISLDIQSWIDNLIPSLAAYDVPKQQEMHECYWSKYSNEKLSYTISRYFDTY